MIHLITLNPAIDEYLIVDDFRLESTNYRTSSYKVMGGKAINVATVLRSLKQNATLVTIVDNKNSFVSESLNSFNSYLIEVDSIRTNLKINDNGKVTEINERGTALTSLARLQFENYLNKCVESGDIVLIAGNPHPSDELFQFELAKLAKSKGAKLYLDSNKFDLEMIVALKPDFIKPNDQELAAILSNNGKMSDLTSACSELIVSHGADGFTYYQGQNEILERPISGKVLNSVGAGDSLVAGFIYASVNGYETANKLKLAKYSASATVYSGKLATIDTISKYDDTNILKSTD